ncbi:unnamed protein product [Sphagnum jensenii]|uniref:Uncharacterized protein n=1 Tax=Sphagnum jensenii TaxID=128206 RepID=A0ABP0VTU6_9BRYO
MSKVQSKFCSASLFATANLRFRSPFHFPEPVPNLGEHPNLYEPEKWSPASYRVSCPRFRRRRQCSAREAVAISSDSRYIRGPSSPQEPRSQTLGAEGDEAAALNNEQQKDHKSMSSASMQSGVIEAIEASEEAALGQRLHGIATQRQQLRLAEELRECEIAVAEPNAMGVQLDAERADFLVQLEHLKGQECILDEGPEKENGAEEASVAKSLSKSKKSSVSRTVNEDPGDDLVFQVGHKVSYKTVLKAQQSLILKASNMVEKLEWIAKFRGCIKLPKDSSMKSGSVKESKSSGNIAALSPGVSGGHVEMSTVLRRPLDLEEELRLMAQEV